MARNQNYDVNYKLRGLLLNGQGGDIVGDLTELEQRILLLEQNKQDNLIAGQGIIFSGNTISAQNIIDDTRNSSTTVWSSNKVKSIVESFEGGVNVVIVDSRPSKSAAIEKTMYYVGNNAPYHIWFFLDDNYVDFGTTEISLENYYTKLEIDNLLGLKVDKEEGKVLIPLEDLEQITTNKNDISDLDNSKVDKEEGKTLISSEDLSQISLNKVNIANLDDQKVDKVSGKSLVLNTSISQITTNKNDIADIKSGINTIQDDISGLTSNKQDKITDSSLSSVSDSTTISSVSASGKTNKTFSLSTLWNWIVGKLTSNTEKGIQVSGGKLGHSNAITAPTAKRILQATYDEQGHVTAIENEFNWSNTYNTSAENQLFTRKGANTLYNWAKITDVAGGNAVTTTGMDSALTRTSGSHQSTVSRVMKYGGVVSLQYFGQYSASKAISGKFTCIGSVPNDYKPVSQVAITVTTWNATPAGSASGYVTTDGKIYVWVSSITSGATNIQYIINATWKAA